MEICVKLTREENAAHYGVSVGDVVRIPLEDYVAGVVASEVGNSALEACKAQAVAARTFAWPYYHAGKIITDDSSKHQAFRAARIDPEKYPRAIQAAQDTANQVLRYQGSVIKTCSYSASNGGRTVSSEERWGGARPWLIAQDDSWDAASGSGRTGHGVGMSQRGAKYAASIGKGYREILAFYYPGTSICVDNQTENQTKGESGMNDKARQTVELAVGQLGSPYVYGTWGSPCKPALRRKYAGYNPGHRDNIYKVCQVLSDKAVNCAGCKYNGRLAFDCRGFTHWVLKQVGIDIAGGGATSQYNTASNWVQRGTIDNMPDLPCCVFKQSGGKMQHTGYHIGGGRIIHCSVGVQEGKITDKGWTHYAVPVGLYEPEELGENNNQNESEGKPMYQAKVTCPGAFLNMRVSKGKGAAMKKKLDKGSIVDVLNDADPDWWYVRQGGVSGYAMTNGGGQTYLMPINGTVIDAESDAADKPDGELPQAADELVEQLRACCGRIQQEMGRMAAMIEAVQEMSRKVNQ